MDSVREPVTKLVTGDVGFGVRTYWVLENRKAKEDKHFLEKNSYSTFLRVIHDSFNK